MRIVTPALLAILPLMACSAADATSHPAAHVTPHCEHQTIEAYCASHGCPTFDEVAAGVRRMATETVAQGGLFRYAIGTCGPYRVIETQTMGSGSEYYDDRGHVVAISGAADAPVCDEERAWSAGSVAKCSLVVSERGGTP